MNERSDLLSVISDDYKSLYDFRPCLSDTDHMTIDELRQWHNKIVRDIQWEINQKQQDDQEHNLAVQQAMTHKSGWSISELLNL